MSRPRCTRLCSIGSDIDLHTLVREDLSQRATDVSFVIDD
jgi:hypothetical protein